MIWAAAAPEPQDLAENFDSVVIIREFEVIATFDLNLRQMAQVVIHL